MTPLRLSSLIGGIFGLIYVFANSGELATTPALVLRIVGALGFVGLLILLRRTGDDQPDPSAGQNPFAGRAYRLVVVSEIFAMFVGIAVVRGPLHAPHAVIAWVSLVVGVHFLALALVWHQSFFYLLGGAIAACGVLGLGLAAGHASAVAIAVVAGILPGFVLLVSAGLGAMGRTVVQP